MMLLNVITIGGVCVVVVVMVSMVLLLEYHVSLW